MMPEVYLRFFFKDQSAEVFYSDQLGDVHKIPQVKMSCE